MEGLGKRLQQARLSRGLTLEEAGRLTKIRPSKLAEIEAEDFSQFASLAYAKGFLLIYGKFLDVDVTRYLEAFETSEHVTVDGYSYLQDNPAPKPTRPVVVRKESSSRGSLWPFVIGVIVLVVGFSVLKLFLDVKRIQPRPGPGMASSSPTATATSDNIVAPRALPADNTPLPRATAPTVAPSAPVAVATATPQAIAAATSIPMPSASEPEVRRAEPVHPEDLAATAASASPAPSATLNRIEIRPLRKTYVKVVVDNDDQNPAAERWLSPSETPLKVSGKRIAVRVLDRSAVEIRKNGKKIAAGDADVTIE
ncbi:MAG: helix-turn-helix domain-containing protein [Verrucomicrobiota bacterium]|nr:helix-turn-helix domain-containing protein [Verrucomicrobiota bacterium]